MTRTAFAMAVCLVLLVSPGGARADTWIEVASPHFTAVSNASEGRTQALVWQLEQLRSAVRKLWPWLQTDLARPMLVMVAKDEQSMRTLAPHYWEQRGGVRPAALWAARPDQYFLAVRADIQDDDRVMVNAYRSAYFIYLHLLVQGSFNQDLPPWFSRGLAGLLSNSLVRPKEVLIGLPLPDELAFLREGTRLRLAELLATSDRREIRRNEALLRFDSQAWAFVHFLYSYDGGVHRQRLERFAGMLKAGEDPEAAFQEAIGPASDYEAAFATYLSRGLYGYTITPVDASIERERFGKRRLSPAEGAAARAALHVALGREKEARALIEEVRKADPDAAAAFVADALLFERAGQREQAREAYARAVALGTTSAYAHYRHAMLTWTGPVDADTLRAIEQSLTRAVQLNTRFAAAYAALGEARAVLKEPQETTLPLVRRAVSLEPMDPWHRMSAARVLWRSGQLDEAATEVQTALQLADTDQARERAQELAQQLEKARAAR